MKRSKKDYAILTLRLVLGVVVLAQSILFLYGGESAKFFGHHGLPNSLRLGLGWTEVLAAILFLAPPTVVAGAWSLLVVFAGAMTIHVLHGQFEVGGLLVYAAAALTVLAHRH